MLMDAPAVGIAQRTAPATGRVDNPSELEAGMSTGQIQNTHIDSDTVRVLAVPSRETDVETASVCVIYDAAAVPSSSEGVPRWT